MWTPIDPWLCARQAAEIAAKVAARMAERVAARMAVRVVVDKSGKGLTSSWGIKRLRLAGFRTVEDFQATLPARVREKPEGAVKASLLAFDE